MKLIPATFESAVYVVIQFACLTVIFMNVVLIPENIYLIFGIALFLLLGIRAIFIMKFNFNIAPEPLSDAKLIIKGPYKYIRHPMYTSVLGITLCYIIASCSIFNLIMFLVLVIVLIMKLNYEEKLLEKRFGEYADYKIRTKKIIPFIL